MSSNASDAPASLHIEMLGGLRVRVGERTIAANEWKQRKGRALLNLLALAAGHWLHREQVLEVLWPDLDPDAASNNLNGAVHAVRRLLEPALAPNQLSTYLHTENNILSLRAPDGLWVDTTAFETAARAARADRNTPAYEAALALYGGDLLPEERYEEWSFGARERLRQVYLTLLEELAQLWLSLGEPGTAIATFERLLASEPVHEGAHLALMRLYAQTGRRYQALRQYQRLHMALQRELDIAPDAQSQRLAAAIRTGEYPSEGEILPWSSSAAWQVPPPAALPPVEMPAETASLLIPSNARTNLEEQTTSFIGRAEELDTIARQLARTRLLTLRGGGGCGKTRLAWQVAASQLDRFRDGVWMVELASLVNPALVPQAVAGALGISEATGQALSVTLAETLRGREMLLVLDNCEHLLEAVATLARAVLAGCPRVRVLATSRRPLKIPGEHIWRVPTMTTPDPDALPAFEELLAHDAIRLFVARATASRQTFRLTPLNALAVVRICQRLDGIPLAIELAAGRCHVLHADQIAARLDDVFAVLGHGGHDHLPRQQTLRASIAWSYDLLNMSEQTLFRRLAVFAGGWTLEAAEAICAGEGLDGSEVLDALGGLVEASLVVSEEHADGMRYRMLEMTRQYAHERLGASDELPEVERRHTAWYVALAEEAEPFLTGSRQAIWMARLAAEGDNLRAALHWARAQRDAISGQRLAGALMHYWYARGMVNEGRAWLDEMLALGDARGADQPVPSQVRARALFGAGWLAIIHGKLERAQALSSESLDLFQAAGDLRGALLATNTLGAVSSERGDYERSRELMTQCLILARQLDDPYRIAIALSNLADLERDRGNFAPAVKMYRDCLVAARASGDSPIMVMGLTNLGDVTYHLGDVEQAVALLKEALALARSVGEPRRLAGVLDILGYIATEQDDVAAALDYHREALQLRWKAANVVETVFSVDSFAGTLARMGEAAPAVRLLSAAVSTRAGMGAAILPRHQERNDVVVRKLRNVLSPQAFEAAWAAGRELPIGQIIAETLESASPVQPRPGRRSKPRRPIAQVPLSPREREVAALIAAGLINREIAKRLRIAERTIDTHVSNILGKLDVRNREEVAAWWQRHATEPASGS